MKSSKKRGLFLLLPSLFFVAACGGSSSNTSSSEPTTMVTGSIFAGPVNGASVSVKNTSGTIIAGPVTTGSDGTYTINISDSAFSNDLIIEATGGRFPDEATGTADVAAGALAAYMPGGSLGAGATVHVTPSTTIIQKLVAGGKSLTDAKNIFNSAFGYIPDTVTAPTDATNPAIGATALQKLAGIREAVFSRLTMDLSLQPGQQFDLITALADDLSDGTLDGMKNGVVTAVNGVQLPANILYKYGQARQNFLADATHNASGITAITEVPTGTYIVSYVAGASQAAVGKTTFQLTVKNKNTSNPVSAASITLTPTMHMSTMSHTTPVDGCSESTTPGTYDCTVYYLMAGGGASTMGDWALSASINSETATFYPAVVMPVGDTAKTALKYINDTITVMGMAKPRQYTLFKDSLMAEMGGTYSFKVFIASQESMMSWPKLYSGMVLSPGTTSELTVNNLSLLASTDNGTTWTPMTEDTVNKGHFSVSGLTGLSSGVQGKIYIKLTINGKEYVDNATGDAAATGAHTYATFTVEPRGVISGGTLHTVALKGNGTAWAWGFNGYGQLGNNTITDSPVQTQVNDLTSIYAIAANGSHTAALKGDGTVWTWGRNNTGQLGNGTTTDSTIPVQVSGLSSVSSIASGYGNHNVARKSDGTVWAWGYNADGELGNGTTTDSSTPVQATGLTSVTSVCGGVFHSAALKSDGTVWTWGQNDNGQLGNGTTTGSTSPVQVSDLSSVSAIACGGFHTMALKSDGTVWAWGGNSMGQLGNGTTTDSSIPVQVSGLSSVTAISGGFFHAAALRSDGAVWTWGWNMFGQLGNGETTDRSMPVQASGISSVTAIACGGFHTIALKGDGTAWTWGRNTYGQLGNGAVENSSIPVSVTGFTR